jgi:metal-responsive CopG/Arc/MetJ family transcriptional regulator
MTRVMITVPDEFLAEIDSTATAQHRSRSELFREAMRQYLKGAPIQSSQSAQEAAGLIERLREKAALRASIAQDSTETIRAIRGYSSEEESIDNGLASR